MKSYVLMIGIAVLSSSSIGDDSKCEVILKEAHEKKHIRVECHGSHQYSYLFDDAVECFLNENQQKKALDIYANLNEDINSNSLFSYHGKWRKKYSSLIKTLYMKEQIAEEIKKSFFTLEINNTNSISRSEIHAFKESGLNCTEFFVFRVKFFENYFIISPKEEK